MSADRFLAPGVGPKYVRLTASVGVEAVRRRYWAIDLGVRGALRSFAVVGVDGESKSHLVIGLASGEDITVEPARMNLTYGELEVGP